MLSPEEWDAVRLSASVAGRSVALSLPGVSTAIVGMDDESQIDENIRLVENLAPLAQNELDTLIEEAKGLLEGDKPSDHSPVFWIYDTKTMAWEENSEPARAQY